MGRAVALAALVAACSGPPQSVVVIDGGEAVDATPPDASLRPLGPALAFDRIELTGANLVFGLLGSALINGPLADQIASGQLLLVAELVDLDDPSGQSDEPVTVGFHLAADSDGDPSNNFDADDPATLIAGSAALLTFADADITGGKLRAASDLDFSLPGDLPLPLQNPELRGTLVSAPDGASIHYLRDGTLTGAVPARVLGSIPNLAMDMCPGNTMLDVLANGCGLLALQPDVDLDGDGLERFYHTGGVIDRCVDGDGTEYLGTDCWMRSEFADGYLLVLSVHATRVLLATPITP
jgi:hypothetical protein